MNLLFTSFHQHETESYHIRDGRFDLLSIKFGVEGVIGLKGNKLHPSYLMVL